MCVVLMLGFIYWAQTSWYICCWKSKMSLVSRFSPLRITGVWSKSYLSFVLCNPHHYSYTQVVCRSLNTELICCWDHRGVRFFAVLEHSSCHRDHSLICRPPNEQRLRIPLCAYTLHHHLFVGNLVSLPISISFSRSVISAWVGF